METKRELLWNEQGAVCCREHAPYAGSDTYVFERWKPMSVSDRAAFSMELGAPVRCETCKAIERRANEVTP